jgi:hypothetical protein
LGSSIGSKYWNLRLMGDAFLSSLPEKEKGFEGFSID